MVSNSDAPVRQAEFSPLIVWDRRIFLIFLRSHFRHGRMMNPKGDGCGEIGNGKLAFSWQARHIRQSFIFALHSSMPIFRLQEKTQEDYLRRISKITMQRYEEYF